MAGGGRSVAEHGPREFVGERVPAFDPLVFVLQAVKPMLQALALGIDAQNNTACGRGVERAARGLGWGQALPLAHLSGASAAPHPLPVPCSKARLSTLPTEI